jgi:glutathionylspermidine synthase
MRRERIVARPDWPARVESLGFHFHTLDGAPYWREDVCYVFDSEQIDTLEAAITELHGLCLEAVDRIVHTGRYAELGLDGHAAALIERSWRNRDPALYGRMDLSYTGHGAPKLLEYNADTPTALLEASVVQWYWLAETQPDADQFNSIHERLVEHWRQVLPPRSTVHFAASYENPEDAATCDYLLDTCLQAGHAAQALDIEQIGWSGRDFIDLENLPIGRLFKLYPWEWMLAEPFAQHLPQARLQWIEPPWKMLLSNKAILPLLWEFFPGHPNLLPASRHRADISGAAVQKPYWGREGQGVHVLAAHESPLATAEPCVFQAFAPLPRFDSRHALVGAWVIGGVAAGIGMREDVDAVTRNTSQFVPHYFR